MKKQISFFIYYLMRTKFINRGTSIRLEWRPEIMS